MKRFLLFPALLLSLALAGCAGSNVGSLISAATTTIANPVDATDIYRVKNVYAATLELANQYRAYCWSKSYSALMADPVAKPICQNRRGVVRAIQAAQPKAGSAVRSAEAFVLQNPTLNATTVVSAAWNAVAKFQSAVPKPN